MCLLAVELVKWLESLCELISALLGFVHMAEALPRTESNNGDELSLPVSTETDL